MLASAGVMGLLMLLSAICTGYLVFKTKRESHETLFAPKIPKSTGPHNIDEFSFEEQTEDEGLPDIIKKMNAKMGPSLAKDSLKGGK